MKPILSSKIGQTVACAVAVVCLTASNAFDKKINDNPSPYVHYLHQPHVYVASNGQEYTQVTTSGGGIFPGTVLARLAYSATNKNKIKSYHLQLRMKYVQRTGLAAVYKGDDIYQDFEPPHRPKFIDTTVSFALPLGGVEDYFVGACNDLASRLRNEGKTKAEIFNKDHEREIKLYASSAVDEAWVPGVAFDSASSAASDDSVKLTCKAMSGPHIPTPGELSIDEGVTESHLFLQEQTTINGSCKIGLSAMIKTNLPNVEVQYRFEHTNGNKSEVKTITTTSSKLAMDSEYWYDVQKNSNEQEAGSVRIIGVSHDFQSPWKTYAMDCRPDSPGGLLMNTVPQLVSFTLKPENDVLHNGWLCPTSLRAEVTLQNEVGFTGRGNIVVRDEGYSLEHHDITLLANVPRKYWESIDLQPWNLATQPSETLVAQPGGAISTPFQRLEAKYVLQKTSDDSVSTLFETPYETILISCRKPELNPHVGAGGIDGLSSTDRQRDDNSRDLQVAPEKLPKNPNNNRKTPKVDVHGLEKDKSKQQKFVDIAVNGLRLYFRANQGNVAGTLRNLGGVKTTFNSTLEIKNSRGKRVHRDERKLVLKAGEVSMVRQTFRGEPGSRYTATLSVKANGDRNRANNSKIINGLAPGTSTLSVKANGDRNRANNSKIINDLAPGTSTQNNKKKIPKPDLHSPKKDKPERQKIVDIAVEGLKLKLTTKRGVVSGSVSNPGTVETRFRYTLEVRNSADRQVYHGEKQLTLKPGTMSQVRKTFKVKAGERYTATLSAVAGGDSKHTNNSKSATATTVHNPRSKTVQELRK